ncbi:hypothetical protein D3C74_436790 [compost metagenome]
MLYFRFFARSKQAGVPDNNQFTRNEKGNRFCFFHNSFNRCFGEIVRNDSKILMLLFNDLCFQHLRKLLDLILLRSVQHVD